MTTLDERNHAWVAARLAAASGRRPRLLWIGCVERMPPLDALHAVADDVLVHSNLANMLGADMNGLAILEYAVQHRAVSHVVICGHDDCDGVRLASRRDLPPLVGGWLQSLHADLLPGGADQSQDVSGSPAGGWLERSCARNVARQVVNVGRTPVVGATWRAGRPLSVLGWILSVHDGRLRAVDQACSPADLCRVADRLSGPLPVTSFGD